MTYAPGDRVIVNIEYVHSVGQQVKTDAQTLLGPGPDSVQDFHDTLTQVNNNKFPIQLYSQFYQFIEAHTNELNKLCQNRVSIGDGLQDTADAAEKTDINNMIRFNSEPNSTLGGPETLPIIQP